MARRGRGEGSIRRRASDGRWEATVTLGGQRRSFYGKTRAEVVKKLTQAQREHEQGLLVGDPRQTVEQYGLAWLEAKRPPELRHATWLIYEGQMRTHIIPTIGRVKLGQVTPQHIQQVMTHCASSGLAASTTAQVYGLLRRLLKSAVRLGLIAQNATDRLDGPRKQQREMRPLTREEAQRLLSTVDDPAHLRAASGPAASAVWLSPLLNLALATGMRVGELMGLRWRSVDLDGGSLSVVASLHWRGGVPISTEPKTRRSRRLIKLHPEMVRRLRDWRHTQRLQRVAAGPAWRDEYDAVFSDALGFPLQYGTIRLRLQRLIPLADVPPIRFHDLRHTCATLLLLQRVNPKIVSELLGHATVSLTLDLYSHVLPDMQDEATAAMATALGW